MTASQQPGITAIKPLSHLQNRTVKLRGWQRCPLRRLSAENVYDEPS
jgi:hypothetical protein